MNPLTAYQNRIFLVDGERFQPFIARAIARPCPSAKDVRKAHKQWMQLAKDLPGQALQGTGVIDLEERADTPTAIRAVKGKIGVINVFGPIDQRMTSELEKCGGTPCSFISDALDSLLGNPSVSAIVMRMDSPGGGVAAIEELSDKIYNARNQGKIIYAHADSMAASAAYWIASAASMVIATPGAQVGSVGVYVMHTDESAAMEAEGFKTTLVSAGKYKTEFSPYSTLSDDAKAEMQGRVDLIYGKFVGALSRNLGVPVSKVRSDFGEGRTVDAQKAKDAGMVHRVLSWDDFMGKLTGGAAAPSQGQRAEAGAVAAKRKQIEVARQRRALRAD